MRLLVVDDDPVFRDEFCDVLDGEGHQVEGAGSTLDAVARLAPGAFDAVFTDLRMPRFTGFDLLKEVRRRAPSTQTVLVTGQADDATALEALRAGALDVLAKPFDFAALQQALATVEEQRAFRERLAPLDSLPSALRKLAGASTEVALLAAGDIGGEKHATVRIQPGNPWPAIAAALEFARAHPSAGLLVRIDRSLLAGIGPSPSVTFIAKLRAGLPPTVRISVGLDGGWLADDAVLALRSALATGVVPPILAPAVLPEVRRVVAQLRIPEGDRPNDTGRDAARRRSRILARLADAGWSASLGGTATLTDEGRRASDALHELELHGDATADGDRCFQIDAAAEPTGRPVE